MSAAMFGFSTMLAHQVSYIQDLGFSPMLAALSQSLVSGFSIAGCLGFGILALRFNMRYLAKVSFVVQLLAIVILLTTKNLYLIFLYAALLGLGNGMLMPALTALLGAYYGRAPFAKIMGFAFVLILLSQAIAPAAAGAIYDATGKYNTAFVLVAVLLAIGLACAFMSKQPKATRENKELVRLI